MTKRARESDAFHEVLGLGPQHRPTGRAGADAWLGGGLPAGQVVELAGPSGAGKSQLVLWLAARLARVPGTRVRIVASDASHDPERLRDLAEERAQLDRIEVQRAGDVDALFAALYHLRDQLVAQSRGLPDAFEGELVMLAIDSVVPLLQPCLGKMPYGHALIFSLRALLQEIATLSSCAVVLTNYLYTKGDWNNNNSNNSNNQFGGGSDVLSTALGPTWATVPHVRIWMSLTDENEKTILTMPAIQTTTCIMRIYKDSITLLTEAEDAEHNK